MVAVAAAAAVAETEAMNPFDLDGPRFLLFYLFFAPAAILFWRLVWIFGTRRPNVRTPVDPLEIAYLRGGPREAIRVAVLGLIERSIVERPSDIILRIDEKVMRHKPSMSAIERALAAFLAGGHAAETTAREERLHAELAPLGENLERNRLIDGTGILSFRIWLFVATLATLLGVSASKIAIAYERGHSNFFFLIVMTLIAAIVAQRVWFRSRITTAGKQALASLQSLNQQAAQPTGVAEVMMQAAIFGAIALPAAGNPYFGKADAAQTGGSSGCGTSGGDGGGDGGGGCGGCGGGGGD